MPLLPKTAPMIPRIKPMIKPRIPISVDLLKMKKPAVASPTTRIKAIKSTKKVTSEKGNVFLYTWKFVIYLFLSNMLIDYQTMIDNKRNIEIL